MPLQNFEKARENMVLSQLQPSGVVSAAVMNAYRAIPREMFVPNALRGVSYLDDDIPLGNGRTLMEPLLHALMLQDANLQPTDKVLDIGSGTGYSAAVLASVAGSVVALEQEEKLLQEASNHWQELGLKDKVTAVVGDHTGGYVTGAPYKAIILNGAVAEIPTYLLGQVVEGGAIYAILMEPDSVIGKVMAIRAAKDGTINRTILGEGVTTYLPGFAPKPAFTF